jgi:ribosomal protein L20
MLRRGLGGLLRKSNIEIDRKMLAEMAVRDPEGFAILVASVTEAESPRV